MSVAKKMKERRIKLNFKIKDIANKIGVAESTYRDWENGRKIQGEPYTDIAHALNMNILELFEIERSSLTNLLFDLNRIEEHVNNIRQSVI